MKLPKNIEKYLDVDRMDEAITLTRQHYTWFIEVFADACKKNNIRRTIYMSMLETLMQDFAKTNANFKPNVFMAYAKKLYGEKEDDSQEAE